MKDKRLYATLMAAAALAMPSVAAEPPEGVVAERQRDSADRDEIIRWYDWSDADPGRIARREFTRCEGTLYYGVEVPETGWYEIWQQGFEPLWNRNWLVDGRPVAESFTTARDESPEVRGWEKWRKELNVFLEAGRHEIGFRRTTFPGAFPTAWRLAAPGAAGRPAGRGMIRVSLPEGVVRAGDEFEIAVDSGGPAGGAAAKAAGADGAAPGVAALVATCDHREDAPVHLGAIEFPAGGMPERRALRCRIPDEGVYTIRLSDGSGLSWNGDCAAGVLVVVDTNAPPAAASLDLECVVDIDCAVAPPLAEVAGETRIVESPAGAYRESSGSAPNPHWALDGFSYGFTLPDDRSAYMLAVDYPDDAFRSVGFWLSDGAKGKNEGRVLTGGVETGGQYPLSGGMLRHEAFFWPRGTNCVLAVLNLNRGSRAAAARIRVHRLKGPLPAAREGIRRGRLAGTFFEENGRWKRHFGMEHDPVAIHSQVFENLRSMERWGEWNRFVGENLMCPSIVAYGGVQYPSRVISGSGVQPVNEARMLSFVAEKYGCKFMPHLTLHGDPVLDRRMGVTVEKVAGPDGKTREVPHFDDPDVVEWRRDGGTQIPWRSWSYNPLHPKVQEYMVAVIDELSGMLSGSPAFAGISIRVPLSWQFSGITGLNNADYGYGDFTMRLFTADTGIDVPEGEGGEKRFAARAEFLNSPEMRQKWIEWRTAKMKEYYGKILAAMRRHSPGAQLNVMFWPSGQSFVRRPLPSLAVQMEECGIAPGAWRNADGISFCGMQFFQGRRYFTPRWSGEEYHRLFDGDLLAMSGGGRRAVCIYTAYYEVNKNLDWAAFGAAEPGMSFDCCVPGGASEMEAWSVPLAGADPGVYLNGGNGWMFGTPRLRSPWLREYLALPPGRFGPLPGVADGAVAFRIHEGGEGRFLYAVNVTAAPASVRIDLSGGARLRGAADGEPADADFTLAPFALRAFEIEGAGGVTASAVADPAIRRRYAGAVPFLEKLMGDFREGRLGFDLPQDFADGVGGCVASAASAFADGRWLDFRAALYDSRVSRLCDLAGAFPPGWWDGGVGGGFGGFPPASPGMPALSLRGIADDVPPVARGYKAYRAEAPDGRAWVAMRGTDSRMELVEYGPDGACRRTATPGWTEASADPLDSRREQHSPRRFRDYGPIAFADGCLWSAIAKKPAAIDPETLRWIPGRQGGPEAIEPVVQNGAPPSPDWAEKSGAPLFAPPEGFPPAAEAARECRGPDGTVYAVVPRPARISATASDGRLLWERTDKAAQSHRLGDVPLFAPAGCAIDGAGRLWVADEGADRILCFDGATGAFIGRHGHSGTRDDRSGEGFNRPRALAFSDGVLFVEDFGNRRVVAFEIGNR